MLVVPSLTQSCVWRLSDLCQCSRLSPRPELHPQDRGPSHCRETTPRSGLKDRVQNTGFLTCSDSNRLKGTNKKKRLKEKLRTPLTDSLIGRLKHDVQSSPTVVNLVDPHSLKAEVLSLIRHWSGHIWT